MTRSARFFLIELIVAAACVAATPAAASAQTRREFVGPGKCTDCHDHKDEKEWSEKRDGDGKGKQHINALNQLADAKADQYAKAIGVADVYDPKSTCVKCHATVVRGSADFGISCESCHGAGKDYLKPHQEKGAYQASLALGLKDTLKKPENWVKDCVTCHVLGENPGDAALIKAGHSSGADFDLGIKFQPVASHWTSKYTANQIAALGNPLRNALARKGGDPVPAASAAASAAPAAAPTVAAPVAPPAAAPAAATAAANPKAVVIPTPGVSSGSSERPTTAPVAAGAPTNRAAPPPPIGLPPPPPPPASPVISTAVDASASLSPASLVGALQGRVAQLLNDLLSRGVRTPVKLSPPATKTPYRGPDAELLRLQEEVIALALEALGTAPPPKSPPQK
ncbi:MAG TPA: multiheme c-type cytochrome [Vicinamibacterales bacterium]|nr:multiheme c-type cytochrome [Vicinamibacterales bacterium]